MSGQLYEVTIEYKDVIGEKDFPSFLGRSAVKRWRTSRRSAQGRKGSPLTRSCFPVLEADPVAVACDLSRSPANRLPPEWMPIVTGVRLLGSAVTEAQP